MSESEKAAERRLDQHAEHTVLKYVERDHSMNGVACENPWAVLRYRKTGTIGFYCGECGVGISRGVDMFDELLSLAGLEMNTNLNSQRYPAKFSAAGKREVFNQRVTHVPPDRLRNTGTYDNE